jgi:hypothetical protein
VQAASGISSAKTAALKIRGRPRNRLMGAISIQ